MGGGSSIYREDARLRKGRHDRRYGGFSADDSPCAHDRMCIVLSEYVLDDRGDGVERLDAEDAVLGCVYECLECDVTATWMDVMGQARVPYRG